MITKRVRTARRGAGDPFHGTVRADNLADLDAPYGVEWRYGIDRAVGGLHDAPNPGELLCAALAACADTTVRMIADLIGVELVELEVEVAGRLDVRGALMIDPEVPVGFQHLNVVLRADPAPGSPAERLDQLALAAERCCLVLATLRDGVPIDVTFEGGTQPASPPHTTRDRRAPCHSSTSS
jgi:uncharacterized OsmC-like protein